MGISQCNRVLLDFTIGWLANLHTEYSKDKLKYEKLKWNYRY